LIDQIKLLAEGHSGIIDHLSGMDVRLDRMEKENARQHLETRALVRISFTPAAEGHGLCPWMNAPTFGRDVAPLGRKAGRHGLCPWGSTEIAF
jgi:hypothetical protein